MEEFSPWLHGLFSMFQSMSCSVLSSCWLIWCPLFGFWERWHFVHRTVFLWFFGDGGGWFDV